MQLTKYEHACFAIEKDGVHLIVDPGNFTSDLVIPENIAAVVITHEHPDHFDQSQLDKIIAKNPHATIIGHHTIIEQLKSMQTKAVVTGDILTIGPFHLEFFGGKHASIYPELPRVANLGMLINRTLYYPGDSFSAPDHPVPYLALPVSAPWMKLSEAIDFLREVNPRFAFPTHDAILSSSGKALADRLISQFAGHDTVYRRIDGETITLD